jgi:YD repeat-containing protein
MSGPPMLPPSDFGRVVDAARRASWTRAQAAVLARPVSIPVRAIPVATRTPARSLLPQAIQNCTPALAVVRRPMAVVTMTPTPDPATPTPCPTPSTPAPVPTPGPTATPTPAALAPSRTGINPWWRYQEQAVPGGGHMMVNIGTGNMVLQDDDMSVAHKGVALTFRRTYNAQSLHDVKAGDGVGQLFQQPGMYGNGWTNTFDAHLTRTNGTLFSVYDIDGARYDYTQVISSSSVTFTPMAGNHSTLVFDGTCGFLWTKKSGTTYYFYRPNPVPSCAALSSTGGYAGRLYQISGRNHNTSVTLAYTWDNGDASATGKIASIMATTDSGQIATLSFADFNGHRLLQQLTYPDGTTTVTYGYDEFGNLSSVSSPPNNGTGARPQHWYGYSQTASDYVMSYAASPRWAAACNMDNCGGDGAYIGFGFSGTGAAASTLSTIQHFALVNPSIGTGFPSGGLSDGVSSGPMQAGFPSYAYSFLTEYYQTSVSTPTFRDSAGHYQNWVVDAAGRQTESQICTVVTNAQCSGTLLVTNTTWDADNNVVAQTDARGYQTDYVFDVNGNAVEVAAPLTSVMVGSSSVQFRPTKRYSYDSHNNVTAFCDEVWSHANGLDWNITGPPLRSDTLCPVQAGTTQFAYDYSDTNEINGRLVTITSALGNHRYLGYSTAAQGGDFGLVSDITTDADQNNDGTPLTNHETLSYDAQGNLVGYSSGMGSWAPAYDSLNRISSVTDPDGITSYRTYFGDGSLNRTESAYQRATNTGVALAFDLDGNVTSETRHYGSTNAATTKKWYDGVDRLVEVQQPIDPSDFYPFPWTTRYLYDLTEGGTVAVFGHAATAYGGLFKTQEYLASSNPTWQEQGSSPQSPAAWSDIDGTAFDGMDRPTVQYRGNAADTYAYDVANAYSPTPTANLGFLSSSCNAANECTYRAFNERGTESQTAFNTPTSPARTFGFDAVGRLVYAGSSNGTLASAFDADGRKIQQTQTTKAAVNPVTLTYHYYKNGKRSSIDIGASSQYQSVLSYSYRSDGRITTLDALGSYRWRFAYSGAGRPTSRVDPESLAASYTTDSYGRVTGMMTPIGGESSIQYDPEGDVLSASPTFVPAGAWHSSSPVYANYTTRGELLNDPYTDPGRSTVTANGVMINSAKSVGQYKSAGAASTSFDAINGLPMSIVGPYNLTGGFSTTGFTYDTAGRQTNIQVENGSYTGGDSTFVSTTKRYDAENHLVDLTYNNTVRFNQASFELGYVWGPTGHPFQIGSTSTAAPTIYQYDSMFWDGDSLLFTEDSSGSVNDIKIGNLADYLPAAQYKLTIWDRDVKGQLIGCHNGSGLGVMNTSAFQRKPTACTSLSSSSGFWAPPISPAATVGRGGLLLAQKSDGLSDGLSTIQGARTFDTQAGVWNTPDVSRGTVHDPASQKAYMWNRNNPYTYSDPSGYAAGTPGSCYTLLCPTDSSPALDMGMEDDPGLNSFSASQLANASGLLGQLIIDAGTAISNSYEKLSNSGKDSSQLTKANVAAHIIDELSAGNYSIKEVFLANGTVLIQAKDETLIGGKQIGGYAQIGVSNDGLTVDLHVYRVDTMTFSHYGYEFKWRSSNGLGVLYYHMWGHPTGVFRPFMGFAAPQAASGAD